jgi:hypothetical protein
MILRTANCGPDLQLHLFITKSVICGAMQDLGKLDADKEFCEKTGESLKYTTIMTRKETTGLHLSLSWHESYYHTNWQVVATQTEYMLR